jgi:hypothetical protein
MTFSSALTLLKQGLKVGRTGWNGKGTFVFLVPEHTVTVSGALLSVYPEGAEIKQRPHIDMRTDTGEIVPWTASQADILADDWGLVVVV